MTGYKGVDMIEISRAWGAHIEGNNPVTHASATKQKKRQTYKAGGFWMDGMRYKIRWDRIAASAGVGALLSVMGIWALVIATGVGN